MLVGCGGRAGRATPEALTTPTAEVSVLYNPGTVLNAPAAVGQRLDSATTAPAGLLFIATCSFRGTTLQTIERLPPLGVRARLVTASRVDQAVLPSTRLTRQARFAESSEATTSPGGAATEAAVGSVPIATATGAVVPGALTTFAFAGISGVDQPAASPTVLEIGLSMPTGAVGPELAVSLTDAVIDRAAEDDESGPADRGADTGASPGSRGPTLVLQRESAVVDRLAMRGDPPRGRFTVAMPYRFPAIEAERGESGRTRRPEGKAVAPDALWIEIELRAADPDEPADAEQIADARRRIAEAVAAESAPAPTPAQRGARSLVEAALPFPANPHAQRRSLTHLATETGAVICQDAALVADDEVLARLARTIADQVEISGQRPMTPAQWGLTLDLLTIKVLAELQSAGSLPEELSAVLALHTGEVGRRAGASEDLLAGGITSRSDLENRLIAENLIALEDNAPATRVRAFDWLSARGRAPEGYDPLGSPRARREALERAFAPSTQPAGT